MNKILNLLLASLFSIVTFGKDSEIKNKYDSYIFGSQVGGIESVAELSKSANSKYNIIISYFINSNNIMYQKTGDQKYLELNNKVVNIIIGQKTRVAYFYKHEGNNELNNKESILFEGYLNRYIAEYAYLIKKGEVYELDYKCVLNYLEDRFAFWRNMSLNKTKDFSFLYGIRLHMGAQWATLALYLDNLSTDKINKDIYSLFIKEFDNQLNINLRFSEDNVIWNSTFDNKFTKSLEKRNEKETMQDTSHGNHVIEYILVQNELGKRNNDKLIKSFSVTFLKNIVGNDIEVSRYVDGSDRIRSLSYLALLSDGWMKLNSFNSDINKYWKNIFKIYEMDKFNSYNQFLAVLY